MYINTILNPEAEEISSRPYLDLIHDSSRGDVYSELREREEDFKVFKERFFEIRDEGNIIDEINKANYCGKTYAGFADIATERKKLFRQLKCGKWWCSTCGGVDGKLHRKWYKSVLNRINIENSFARQLIFTIPDVLRDRFKSKKMLNSYFNLVENLIKSEFGVYTGDKIDRNGVVKEKKYSLNKPAISYLHINGQDKETFNPHINVHIFEKHGENRMISKHKRSQIAKSYRKRLMHLLGEDVQEINFHYRFIVGASEIKRAIYYMTKPIDMSIENLDMDLRRLLFLDMKGMSLRRFLGKASNSEYKKAKGDGKKKKPSKILEINGEAYKFIGILSQAEFDEETKGKTLSCTPEGFIIALDEFPDASSG